MLIWMWSPFVYDVCVSPGPNRYNQPKMVGYHVMMLFMTEFLGRAGWLIIIYHFRPIFSGWK